MAKRQFKLILVPFPRKMAPSAGWAKAESIGLKRVSQISEISSILQNFQDSSGERDQSTFIDVYHSAEKTDKLFHFNALKCIWAGQKAASCFLVGNGDVYQAIKGLKTRVDHSLTISPPYPPPISYWARVYISALRFALLL